MTKTNSVVAIYDTHSLAEEAVKNLQRSGFDMKKLSIVGKAFEKGGSIVSWPGSERGRPILTPDSRANRERPPGSRPNSSQRCRRCNSSCLQSLLDRSRCRLDAVHPESEPGCVIVGHAVAANVRRKARKVSERNLQRLRAHERGRQPNEKLRH